MRRRALSVLRRVEARQGFASDLLRTDDPPFLRELVLGVIRRQLTLDSIHAAFASRPLTELEVDVRIAVRLGLYQLLFLDGIPPHAAVAETVGSVRSKGGRGYVNGVLRSVLRESHKVHPDEDRGGASPSKRFERPGRSVTFFSRPVFPDPERDRVGWLAAVHSHPELLVRRWLDSVGEQRTLERLQAGNVTPTIVLRPRRGRADASQLVDRLAKDGVASRLVEREHGAPAVEVAPGAKGLFKSGAWRSGLCMVQEPEQWEAVEILAPAPGETIWDACAAPGGKAAQIAELLGAAGRVVASDVDARRLEPLRETIQRLGLQGVELAAHDVLSEAAPPGKPASGFDAILVDAPCSNTAVLARRPEARWRVTEERILELAELQSRMLAAARRHLAPGGRLVYSVCTHEPEEREAHGLQPTRSPFAWVVEPGGP